MKKYKVEITETLQTIITVEANSEDEAIDIVHQKYRDEEIVLDSSNYIDTDFSIYSEDLPTEDEIRRPGGIDNTNDMEIYVKDYLENEYNHAVKSFDIEYDMRKVYITEIVWEE